MWTENGISSDLSRVAAPETVENASYDVVIVGAGTSAAIVADKLTRDGFRVLIVEAGLGHVMSQQGYQRYLETFYSAIAPRGYFAQPSYSSIGYIGPAATGICLAKKADQRVMVFTGDGGFQMSALCVATQTRYGLNPIIFVIDNKVFAVEQWLADASVFSSAAPFKPGLDVHPCEYAKLADVVGCKGWKAANYGDLEKAVKEALNNTTSPSIIQVVVDAKSIPTNAEWKEALDAKPKP